MPTFAAAVADYLHAPVIERIGLELYRGGYGDEIRVDARDRIGVTAVDVIARLRCGTVLEHGHASLLGSEWLYRARSDAPAKAALTIEAVARDYAGNETTRQETWKRTSA